MVVHILDWKALVTCGTTFLWIGFTALVIQIFQCWSKGEEDFSSSAVDKLILVLWLIITTFYFVMVWLLIIMCRDQLPRSLCCSPDITPERNMTDDLAEEKLAELVKNQQLTQLSELDHDYQTVKTMTLYTWQHDDRMGRDSKNLSHRSIKIKGIYQCSPNNQSVKNVRSAKRKKANCESQWLKKTPILTSIVEVDKPGDGVPLLHHSLRESFSSDYSEDSTQPGVHTICQRSETVVTINEKPNTGEMSHSVDSVLPMPATNQPAYLFHGTKVSYLLSILENNLDIKYAKKGLYGSALYFAESSEKADQYADCSNCRRQKNLTLLLYKVDLGVVRDHEKNKPIKKSLCWNIKPQFDSVVAGHNKRFREFLLFDSRRCAPCYLIVYDRVSDS